MMSNSRLVWTDEMKNTLLRYWHAGMDHTEIADRMGLKMEQISGALQRARRGEWGANTPRDIRLPAAPHLTKPWRRLMHGA